MAWFWLDVVTWRPLMPSLVDWAKNQRLKVKEIPINAFDEPLAKDKKDRLIINRNKRARDKNGWTKKNVITLNKLDKEENERRNRNRRR